MKIPEDSLDQPWNEHNLSHSNSPMYRLKYMTLLRSRRFPRRVHSFEVNIKMKMYVDLVFHASQSLHSDCNAHRKFECDKV